MVEEVSKIDHWGQEVYKKNKLWWENITKHKDVTCNPISYASFIYSHLIIAAKFNMVVAWHRQKGCGKIGSQVYTLLVEAFQHI
jgi:hypothetical protein